MRPVFIPDGFNVVDVKGALDGFNVSSIKTASLILKAGVNQGESKRKQQISWSRKT